MVAILTLNLPSIHTLTDEQFFELCSENKDLQFEQTADRVLIIMPPTGGETGRRNVSILFQLETWSQINQAVEVLQNPSQLSGEDILKGFILDLNSIFNLTN